MLHFSSDSPFFLGQRGEEAKFRGEREMSWSKGMTGATRHGSESTLKRSEKMEFLGRGPEEGACGAYGSKAHGGLQSALSGKAHLLTWAALVH